MDLRVQLIGSVESIPYADICRFEEQPRVYFDEDKMNELVVSIKTMGQQEPIHVKVLPPGNSPPFQLIDGERRWRACGELNIPVLALKHGEPMDTDLQHLKSVIYNEGQLGLEVLEKMRSFRKIGTDFKLSVRHIAKLVGRSYEFVRQYWSLGDLDPKIQKMMEADRPKESRLSFSQATLLMMLPKDIQLEEARRIVQDGLSVTETRELVKKHFVGISAEARKFRLFLKNTLAGSEIMFERKTYFDDLIRSFEPEETEKALRDIAEIVENLSTIQQSFERVARKKTG